MKAALRVIIFVIIMGTVSSGLLVGLNQFTSPMIAKNEELRLKSSVLDALEISYNKDNILNIFDDNVKPLTANQLEFYTLADGAVAFEIRGPGLWGPITGIISLEKDLKTIRNIKITHQEETPGLGSRIAEEKFLGQFKNKNILPRLVFMPEGKASKENEIDAITGATGSSRAFEKLINENLNKYLAALKEVK